MGRQDIGTLASAIASDNHRALEQLFGEGQIPPAVYYWRFSREGLVYPPLQELHERWQEGHDAASMLDTASGKPRGLSADTCRYLMVVEPDVNYSTVRYHYYGAGIAETYGKDLTGKTSSAFSAPIATFFVGAYLATAMRGAPLLTRHRPPPTVPVKHWQRLILPPAVWQSGDKQTVWFLAANVPVRA